MFGPNTGYPMMTVKEFEKFERHMAMKTAFMFALRSESVHGEWTVRFYFRLPNAWMSIDQDFPGEKSLPEPNHIQFYPRDCTMDRLTPWNEECWKFCRPDERNMERVIKSYLTQAAVMPSH